MWADAKYWFPHMLTNGRKFNVLAVYPNHENAVASCHVVPRHVLDGASIPI